MLAVEAIVVGLISSNGNRWLPGQLLGALAHGGMIDASYGHALVTLAVYMALIATATLVLFRRRDA